MYRIPIATHNRIVRGEIPILYMVITTHLGDRAYAKKTITAAAIAGSLGCLARVLSFGSFERTLSPKKNNLLASYTRKQQQHISVMLDNADKYFSILLGKEPFLSRPINIYIGFEDEAVTNHINIFNGVISEVGVSSALTLEADEKSSDSPTGVTLDDTFYLARAGSYANPLNTASVLPIVYGDLTDGDEGIWTLPCIDTLNYVYCYAGHPVLTDNDVSIYADGALVNPATYTFNPSHYFEPPSPPPAIHVSSDNIATVTFTSDQGTAVITAKGKGKVFLPIDLSGEELITNIVDIVDDFLCEENDFTSSLFEASKKAQAKQIFNKWSYVAAGVIHQDGTYWDIITSMMSSFLGSAYLNGAGQLVLEIDDGSIDQYSAGTPPTLLKQETTMTDAVLRMVNVVNQCPINYAYNHSQGKFLRETDDSAHADGISQGIYGIRKPDAPYQCYWCRDLTIVQLIQDTIVGKFNSPLYEIEVTDITLKRMHVDVGDAVIYSADFLYDQESAALIDNIWRVISVRPDFAAGKIIFRLLQIFYRAGTPKVVPEPWSGILQLIIPDLPAVSADTSLIEEEPVAPDTVELTIPDVPTVSPATIVHNSRECTISIAAPCLVTCADHGAGNTDIVFFKTTGALPTALTVGDWLTGGKYYVRNKTTDDFNLSLTAGGSLIDTSGTQSGTHRVFGETIVPEPTGWTEEATGGTITHSGGKTIHTFLLADSGTAFTPPDAGNVEVLVIAGGGGGGGAIAYGRGAGGGGAGGYLYDANFAIADQAYTVTVGDGGNGGAVGNNDGSNGSNSVFSTMTAVGGGGGAKGKTSTTTNGLNGGSGGGGSCNAGTGGTHTTGQGYDGGAGGPASGNYTAGGGGGSSAVGVTGLSTKAGNGGAGTANSISGASVNYAGGGGGGSYEGTSSNAGTGQAGGGDGGYNASNGGAATSNTGSGGGGAGPSASTGGAGGKGGSGIVIISYPTP